MEKMKPVDEYIHVMPMKDIFEHEESPGCPCQPVWDDQNKEDFKNGKAHKKLLVHKMIKENLN